MDRVTRQVLETFRGQAALSDEGVVALLEQAGVSRAWLSKVVSTDGGFSCDVAERLLNTVGYELRVVKRG